MIAYKPREDPFLPGGETAAVGWQNLL